MFAKVTGFAGAVLMTVGVFMPFVKAPVLGAVDYFGDGKGDGVFVLVFAGVSVAAIAFNGLRALWLTGTGAAATLIYTFYNYYTNMESVIRKAGKGGKVFGDMAKSITESITNALEIEIGVPIIVAGILLTFTAAAIGGGKKKKKR